VHLVGFIIKKFVTMHGHMNVKKVNTSIYIQGNFSVKTIWVTIQTLIISEVTGFVGFKKLRNVYIRV